MRSTRDTLYHMKYSQIRRVRKLSEAVFRGAQSVYTFDVFPLTTDIRDSAAVFIISRRITDRFKSSHHRAICVGETESIVSEIKKHNRAKCVKTYEANAVCILRENDRTTRFQMIDDLVTARSFDCVRNVIKSSARSTANKEKVAAAEGETQRRTKSAKPKREIKQPGAPKSRSKMTKQPEPSSSAHAKQKPGKLKTNSVSTSKASRKAVTNVVKIADQRKKKPSVAAKPARRKKAA